MTLAEKHKIKAEEKKLEKEEARAKFRLNQIKPTTNACFNILFVLLSFVCLFPVFYVFMISVSSTDSITKYGYRLFPDTYSTAAYTFLWNERGTIFNSLIISVVVTVMGTVLGVLLTTMIGYVLSRPNYKLKGFFTWMVFIPMIFNGGMVANYVVFRTTVPDSIIESAKIDGASQMKIFWRIVVPISKPVFATIALFLTFGYWNDWFQSALYISDSKLVSLQALLNNMMKNLEYIANNPSAGLSLQQYRNSMPSESVRMAIAIIIVIPIACAYPFFQKYFISGLTVGAVKG